MEAQELNISRTIAAEDLYAGNAEHYFSVGRSALQCIRLSMLAADKREVHRILDLPCGHGRVLRTLRAAFPSAQITACDIVRDGVDFCAKEFDAHPIYSEERPEDIRINQQFDLIWCGSLLTHLDADRWPGFINLFNSLLAPNGLAVVTFHGSWIVTRMRRGEENYGLESDKLQKLLTEYDRQGFGFGNYFHASNYGISASSPAWVWTRLKKSDDIRIVNLTERGWDNHQDVISYVKNS